jgi:hypothetical protein
LLIFSGRKFIFHFLLEHWGKGSFLIIWKLLFV